MVRGITKRWMLNTLSVISTIIVLIVVSLIQRGLQRAEPRFPGLHQLELQRLHCRREGLCGKL